MKKYQTLIFLGLCLAFVQFSCKNEPAGPWEAFTACATNACVKEAVAVKDAFLKDPKPIMDKFEESNEQGTDHYIGWLYIIRDSVLLNSNYASTEERFSMQQQILDAAKTFENDPAYSSWAKSIIDEIGMLAIASELEDDLGAYAPVTGTFSYELPNDGGSGELKTSLNTDESLRFELSVVAGPPAHNQGMMAGLAKQTGPNTYEYSTTEFGGNCRLQFTFDGESVKIETLEGESATCGFGNNVTADNIYQLKNFEDPFLSEADAKMVKNLQGNWVSTTDSKSEITIENGMYTDIYDGQLVEGLPYAYHPVCPKDCNPIADTPCLTVMGQEETICYTIVSADGNTLELSMIGGTGNTLVFKRK